MKLLVLCLRNSARSILLESILNHDGKGRLTAYSAGSHPAGRVHPAALSVLTFLGHDVSAVRSKSWDEFAAPGAPEMDAVVTVCDAVAAEACPIWPGTPVRAHWGVGDPAGVPEVAWDAAFDEIHATLAHRARLFLDLPFETMERQALARAMTHIGALP